MTDTSTGSRQVSCPDCGRPVEPGAEICACGFPLMFLQEEERAERPAAPTRRPGDDDDTGPIPLVTPRAGDEPLGALGSGAGGGGAAPQPLGTTCSVCGEVNDPGRTWCARCGSALRPRRDDTEVLPPAPPPRPRHGRRRLVAALAGVLLVAGAGGAAAGWFLQPDEDQDQGAAEPEPPAESEEPAAPGPLPVETAVASDTGGSSKDADGNVVTYEAENMIDGNSTTAWRAPHSEALTLTFQLRGGPREVTAVGLVPGYAKTDPVDGVGRFPENRRVTLVEWRFDDGPPFEQVIPSPRPEMTLVELPEPVVTGRVVAVIRETLPGSRTDADNTAVSEVQIIGR